MSADLVFHNKGDPKYWLGPETSDPINFKLAPIQVEKERQPGQTKVFFEHLEVKVHEQI